MHGNDVSFFATHHFEHNLTIPEALRHDKLRNTSTEGCRCSSLSPEGKERRGRILRDVCQMRDRPLPEDDPVDHGIGHELARAKMQTHCP